MYWNNEEYYAIGVGASSYVDGVRYTTSKNISDGFSAIAERAFKRERQISHTPFSINKKDLKESVSKSVDSKSESFSGKVETTLSKYSSSKQDSVKSESVLDIVGEYSSQNEVNIKLKKTLTDREQLVFEYFLNNIGKPVFAKDLAELLELPRDYVYKYIKNLRAKIEGDKLKNVPSGGFVLTE